MEKDLQADRIGFSVRKLPEHDQPKDRPGLRYQPNKFKDNNDILSIDLVSHYSNQLMIFMVIMALNLDLTFRLADSQIFVTRNNYYSLYYPSQIVFFSTRNNYLGERRKCQLYACVQS